MQCTLSLPPEYGIYNITNQMAIGPDITERFDHISPSAEHIEHFRIELSQLPRDGVILNLKNEGPLRNHHILRIGFVLDPVLLELDSHTMDAMCNLEPPLIVT